MMWTYRAATAATLALGVASTAMALMLGKPWLIALTAGCGGFSFGFAFGVNRTQRRVNSLFATLTKH